MRAYSMDLRERVLAACDAGWGRPRRPRRTRSARPGCAGSSSAGGRRARSAPRPAAAGAGPALAAQADRAPPSWSGRTPDLTPAEYRDRLGRRGVAPLTVWRALRRLGLTFKKSRSGRPSRTGRTSPPRRAAWRAEVTPALDPAQAGVHRRDVGQDQHDPDPRVRPAGRAAGRRASRTGTGTRPRSSAALRADGFVAPMVLDGAVNGELFLAYVEQVLVPELAAGRRGGDGQPGEPQGGRGAAGDRGGPGARLLYLPPYSPDLNPIENAFSQAQAAAAGGGRADRRRAVGGHRPAARPVRPGTSAGTTSATADTPLQRLEVRWPAAGISVFVVSTFDTDYLLVRDGHLAGRRSKCFGGPDTRSAPSPRGYDCCRMLVRNPVRKGWLTIGEG